MLLIVALIVILGAMVVTHGHPLRLRGSMQIFVEPLAVVLMWWVQGIRLIALLWPISVLHASVCQTLSARASRLILLNLIGLSAGIA